MKYTGRRQEQFETLEIARRVGAVSKDVYRETVKDLNRKEKIAIRLAAEREVARAAREAKKEAEEFAAAEAKAAARKVTLAAKARARRAAKKDSRIIASFPVPVYSNTESEEVSAISKAAKGHVELVVRVNGIVVRSDKFDFETESMSLRHTILRIHFYYWEGSAGATIFDATKEGVALDPTDTIEVTVYRQSEKLTPKKLVQKFAEGILNCVAEPLAKMWDRVAERAIELGNSSPSTISKSRQHARACRAYGLQYPDGIPEGEPMEQMARIARRRIIIYDVLSGEYATYNAKSPLIERFTNTRENHLDSGHISFNNMPVYVTAERLQEIIYEHGHEHYMFEGSNGKETAIRSARGCWAVTNPLYEMYKLQDELNTMDQFGFEAVSHKSQNDWLHSAVVIQAAPIQLGDGPIEEHIDMETAYTQHRQSSYFQGFPGKVQQWRRLEGITDPRKFIQDHFGLYKFRVTANTDPILVRLGVEGVLILPCVELAYYMDRGVSVELLSAVFTSKLDDIAYTEEMITSKAYKTWTGCLGRDKPTKKYHFKGTKEWAEHLASLFGERNVKYLDGCIELTRNKTSYKTRHHIYAFITAYTRMNTLEAIQKIGVEKVVGVQMDGIFLKTPEFEMPSKFRVKDYCVPKFSADVKWFSDKSDVDDSSWPLLRDERLLTCCVLSGQGGTGKTYSLLHKDDGFDSPWNDMVYIVPQHDLGQDKKEEFKVYYHTYHAVAGLPVKGKKTMSLKEKGIQPACMLLDEGTMVDATTIDTIRTLYPHTLLFFAADVEILPDGRFIWFQCRNGRPGAFSVIWQPPSTWGWMTYTTDYRSGSDDRLKELKLWLRARMRENFTDGGQADAVKLMIQIDAEMKLTPFRDAVAMFKDGDTWIAGTNQKSVRLVKEGVVSGWVSRNGLDHGKKSFVEMEGWEKRGSFTTHSFQGMTVQKGKLFVSINDAFEHAMIYTAVSRATSFDQIVLVC